MQRPSWLGGGADAEAKKKEEAARITREADIRRLSEAGTAREILEQLYTAEDVQKVVQKMEEEEMLLKVTEQQQELEKEQEKAKAAAEKSPDEGSS